MHTLIVVEQKINSLKTDKKEKDTKEQNSCNKLLFFNPISLQPDFVDLSYFSLNCKYQRF